MELWDRFYDLLMQSEHFRSGFIWGVVCTVLAGWLLSSISSSVHAQWHRIRQFFEPTKKPAKIATETGPSPASALMGCLVSLFIMVLVVGTVIMAILWQTNSLGR
jgi:hypothetical protein